MSASVDELAYVGLGSNLDEPEQQVRRALQALAGVAGLRSVATSSFYRTRPWGNPDQPDFINAVAVMESELAPVDLLREALAIERRLGRVRDSSRWAPRTIDIDLLLFGRRKLTAAGLNLPHPHAMERAFVLVPLVEVGVLLADPRLGEWQFRLSNLPHDDVIRLHPKIESRPMVSV